MLDRISQQLEKYMDFHGDASKTCRCEHRKHRYAGLSNKDIAFQMEFQTLTDGEKPRVVEVPELKVKNDGNDVNLDREARMLAENNLRFTFAENMLHDRIKEIRAAIQETKS